MIVTVDQRQLADLARREADKHPARSRERRAAAALWVALSDTKTIAAARQTLTEFAAPQAQADAVRLLYRLAREGDR